MKYAVCIPNIPSAVVRSASDGLNFPGGPNEPRLDGDRGRPAWELLRRRHVASP